VVALVIGETVQSRLALTGQVARPDDTGFVAAELRDPQVSWLAMGAAGQPGQARLPGGLPDQVASLGNAFGDMNTPGSRMAARSAMPRPSQGIHDPEALQRRPVTLPRRCGDHPAVDPAGPAAGQRKQGRGDRRRRRCQRAGLGHEGPSTGVLLTRGKSQAATAGVGSGRVAAGWHRHPRIIRANSPKSLRASCFPASTGLRVIRSTASMDTV
jgi:hypothetical protein